MMFRLYTGEALPTTDDVVYGIPVVAIAERR
jgi:hypothetical protein